MKFHRVLLFFSTSFFVILVGCQPYRTTEEKETNLLTNTVITARIPASTSVLPTDAEAFTPEPELKHGDSFSPKISADGRYVVFTSRSAILIDGDTPQCIGPNGQLIQCSQVFVYDRQNGIMKLASISSEGSPANGNSGEADISSGGRWVVFRSGASNLRTGNSNRSNLFVHDLKTGATEMLKIGQNGWQPTISADGRFITFSAHGNNMLNVYVYDRQEGLVRKLSSAYEGGESDGDSLAAKIAADGRWVAFWSWAGNLVPGDIEKCRESETNYSCGDVFIYDMERSQTSRIIVGVGYGLGMGQFHVSLSEDGELVLFGCSIFNRRLNQFICGDSGGGECCGNLSADGQWIVYGGVDIYVRELATGLEELVSVSNDGIAGDGKFIDYSISNEGESFDPGFSISADGRWVVFASTASNLDSEDIFECSDGYFPPHNCYDIFIRDRETGATEWISKPNELRK